MAKRAGVAPILLTGFAPFDGAAINPSWEVARALHGRQIAGVSVIAAALPVAFELALPSLQDLIAQHRPQLVVSLGLAAGRAAISLERVAINLIDARIADNLGAQPVDEPVLQDAPAAYFATLPIKAMRRAIETEGVPAEISYTAGTFVCNQVMFAALHFSHALTPAVRAGLIHLPWSTGLGEPALDLAVMVHAIEQALTVALQTPSDLLEAGGTTH
ncbi:pyroglutamyl-peptidase I [Lampropedia aestuarii]|uniref:pyroglutamyl-peptidase I n=1 Tax=Lampropedia aestuarii TaxID=2562762 RepID=UPI0024689332|nr:pyroglutamyl-peptidase I [Lampropedia aestuarii]MDH5856249.1 pyroglutamyl-peptidase I [Lampropedia aestuarii]